MRHAAAAAFALALSGMGCASMQETTMYRGPFGRTQIASTILAADRSSGKVLVRVSDGTYRVFRVSSGAASRLSTFRVGDEMLLTFDDTVSGDTVVAMDAVDMASRANLPSVLAARTGLPSGLRVGAPVLGGTRVARRAGDPVTDAAAADVGSDMVEGGTGGVSGGGFVGNVNADPSAGFVGPGVVIPGFGSISDVRPGILSAQDVSRIGLGAANGQLLSADGQPLSTTGQLSAGALAVATGGQAGTRAPFTQGNFTPGTVAPGVRTTSPISPGAPVIDGNFTPGTIAPGVSASRGNAPRTGAPGELTIRTRGAGDPVPDSVSAAGGRSNSAATIGSGGTANGTNGTNPNGQPAGTATDGTATSSTDRPPPNRNRGATTQGTQGSTTGTGATGRSTGTTTGRPGTGTRGTTITPGATAPAGVTGGATGGVSGGNN